MKVPMLDLKWLSENLDLVQQSLKDRGSDVSLTEILSLNEKRKALQLKFDNLRAEQKNQSKEIGLTKKEGRDTSKLMAKVQKITEQVKELDLKHSLIEKQINEHLLRLPNLPHDSVPTGQSEQQNREERTWGEKPQFDFKPKEHWELGEALGGLDFERGAKVAGSRFTFYRGALAKLERALAQFMLDTHTEKHGYEEIIPPYLVSRATMTGTGQLPKFESDAFKTTDDYFLIPTAEVPVTNIFRDEILEEKNLPYSFCAFSPCFRSEAGSYSSDIKGLIRQRQFHKVELVKITHPDHSYEELEKLTGHAEKILQLLNLPYRVVTLCTGDMGFSAAKTYDIEVWLPGQNKYREISSCSNCEAFQARRMNTRFRSADKKLIFVHTINGSGLAVGRTLIAVMENGQQKDGSILIPEVLQKYMGMGKISNKS